ncbi:MAG: YihY/virulence factor BrkB family protein [Candidatus Electrothrix sp. AW5]|nr:YihY/virulence factor BrkB family protein [Candidatus Electrothrix gigas]
MMYSLQSDVPVRARGRLSRWSFSYFPQEKKIVKWLRGLLRILLIMVHEFSNTNIALRSSALTFSVILSMVPLLAMSTALLKGLGNGNQMREAAYHFIDKLDPDIEEPVLLVLSDEPDEHEEPDESDNLENTPDKSEELVNTEIPKKSPPDIPATSETSEVSQNTSEQIFTQNSTGAASKEVASEEASEKETLEATPSSSLNYHLHQAVDTIFDYVENTNFAALGAFGIVGLLIVVVMVLSSVEDAMNAIWHTRRGRSLFRKIMDYLALLVLLPISINITLAGDAILRSPKIMSYIATVVPSAWTVQMLLKLLPFLFITLSLMMMYLFFPNVKVKTTAAFCGALFGAIFWFIVQRAYVILQIGVAKYNAIYGSFATVPLFLIWIQLGWIFILLGATLAYAIQHCNSYQLLGVETSTRQELQRVFDILITVYNNFAAGQGTPFEQLIDQCQVMNENDLARPLELLVLGEFLYEIEQDEVAVFIPCCPPEQVDATRITRLILGQESDGDSVGSHLADQIIRAAENVILTEDFLKKSKRKGDNSFSAPMSPLLGRDNTGGSMV